MNQIAADADRLLAVAGGEESQGSLARFVGIVSEQRWLIGIVAAATLSLGIFYWLVRPPIYQSDAVVQVVAQQSGGLSGIVQLSALLQGSALPTPTEIQLIQSRAVVAPVVRSLHLDIRSEYAGLAGLPIVRTLLHPDSGPATLSTFEVPQAWENKRFTVQMTGPGRYRLLDPDGNFVLNGRVGAPAGAKVQTEHGPGIVTILIDKVTTDGDFHIRHVPLDLAVNDLLQRMSVEEEGDQTGIIDVALRGESAGGVATQVNAIADSDVRQNVHENSAQAAGELLYLQRQIPGMEAKLQDCQAKLAAFLATRPTVAAFSQSAEYVVQQVGAVEQQMAPLQSEIAQAQQLLGASNPRLQAMQAQMRALQSQHDQLLGNIGKLPKDEQTYVRLQSDVTTDQTLYASMLNQIETLQIAEAGTVGDIVIVDRGLRTYKPVAPKPEIIVPLALLAGLFLGICTAFLRRSLRQAVEDPNVLDEQLSLPVHAVIAHSSTEQRLERQRKKGKSGSASILAAHSNDPTTEGLRSLRTAMQLAMAKSGSKVLSLTSLGPHEGKSFVSTNVALLFAQSGVRVLLVDADMRRGHIHRTFGWPRPPGLAEVLRGSVTLDSAVRATDAPNLNVLTTGALPEDASNLLVHANAAGLLKSCSALFDLVVLDLPPVLAVSDAYILARHADLNLLLLKHGTHSLRQVRMVLKRFAQHGVTVHGAVMNDVSTAAQRYAYREYGYQYQYHYK